MQNPFVLAFGRSRLGIHAGTFGVSGITNVILVEQSARFEICQLSLQAVLTFLQRVYKVDSLISFALTTDSQLLFCRLKLQGRKFSEGSMPDNLGDFLLQALAKIKRSTLLNTLTKSKHGALHEVAFQSALHRYILKDDHTFQ